MSLVGKVREDGIKCENWMRKVGGTTDGEEVMSK